MKNLTFIITSLLAISLTFSSCCGKHKGNDAEYERYLDSLATFSNSDTFKICVPVPRAKTNLDYESAGSTSHYALPDVNNNTEDGMRGWDPETEDDNDAGMRHMMEEYYESDRRQWLPE